MCVDCMFDYVWYLLVTIICKMWPVLPRCIATHTADFYWVVNRDQVHEKYPQVDYRGYKYQEPSARTVVIVGRSIPWILMEQIVM